MSRAHLAPCQSVVSGCCVEKIMAAFLVRSRFTKAAGLNVRLCWGYNTNATPTSWHKSRQFWMERAADIFCKRKAYGSPKSLHNTSIQCNSRQMTWACTLSKFHGFYPGFSVMHQKTANNWNTQVSAFCLQSLFSITLSLKWHFHELINFFL